MPKIIIDDNKGLYQTSGKGVVGLTQSKTVNASWSSGASIQAAPITIPANSLITAVHAVITSTLTGAGAGTTQVKVGTAALGTEICIVKNIANIAANASAAGKGISTVSTLTTALQGTDTLVITAGEAFQTDEVDLYASAIRSTGGDFTGGAVQFTIEFVTFE